MDEEAYLLPNFDPTTLRVANLRGILLKHDIPYPSSAKKADLVALFNQHIAPRAKELRAASAVVLPSTTGMINAGETPPVRRTGRRSTRGVTEDGEPTPAKTPVAERKTPGRSTRRSSAKPVVYETPARAPTEEPTAREEEDDTPFSNKNPFQSGSPANVRSPLGAGARRVHMSAVGTEGERDRSPVKRDVGRRKTDVGGSVVLPRTSERRRTEVPRTVREEVRYEPEREKEERLPVYSRVREREEGRDRRRSSRREPVVKKESEYEEGDMSELIEPGEEFVPEEAAELEAAGPEMEVVRRGEGFDGAALVAHAVKFFMVLLIPMLCAYGAWYRAEKIKVGYCGVGGLGAMQHHQDHLVDWLRPECEPCPPHARCFPHFQLECEDNYIKSEKWMSFNGLLPITPDCLPDTARERRISIMSDAALQILRESGAHQRCKERFLSSDMPIEGVSEEDIRQVLYNRKSAALSDREFAELWRAAIGDVAKHDEISVRRNENGTVHYASSSLAALPLGCYIRFSLQESLARHKGVIAGILTLLASILHARNKLRARREYNEKVTRLVHICLRRLSQHAARNPANPYVAIVHLRDQVLEKEFSIKKRQELWSGVEKIVEMNSNVRAAEREIEGEPLRVWSWIGGKFIDDGMEEEMMPVRGIKQEPVEEERLALPDGREEKVHWNARRRHIL